MQFKHPEILWALFLLLIPILIHLFQLRRFKRTPFTNVAMLQRVVSESRKSNSLKKWLLLFTRLLLLACIIIAFAQPFLAKETALQEKELVIYLDDSFSMQAKKDAFSLLEIATQDLVKSIPSESRFSLFTNTKTYKDVTLKSIQNRLLSTENQPKQLTYDQIVLKSKTLFSDRLNTQKNLIIISDFQEQLGEITEDSLQDIAINLVSLKPENTTNIAIDSVYLINSLNNQIEMGITISGLKEEQSIPISIFDDTRLIAKTAVEHNPNQKASTTVSLQEGEAIKGRISLSDNSLTYDNTFFFNIEKRDKINVLAISETDSGFLNRIYTDEEFNFKDFELRNLDYSQIDAQNLIILNGISAVPTGLQTVLKKFHQNGGSLVIIPGQEISVDSYNAFLSNIFSFKYVKKNIQEQKITTIAFNHPLLVNVFEKQVANFEYPSVKSYWNVKTNGPKIVSFANGEPLLIGDANFFIFTAALNSENSNFKNAPLIVPTFYNMAINSFKMPKLYLTIGNNTTIDIPNRIAKDNVVKVTRDNVDFIPLQKSYSNKVNLTFIDNPAKDGIYSIVNGNDTLSSLAFNFNRKESVLRYQNINNIDVKTIQDSIPQAFKTIAKDNSIDQYWKWFVIFALIFALVEVLIQKFLA
ncbi:BatA domain-containing protein [uncultured Croceitalea sp.]|uniref:BatA domain-containing protein n=1 Tax=uncultured Croceitalea sp. TaxID=1798908 RepID=UPI00374E8E61